MPTKQKRRRRPKRRRYGQLTEQAVLDLVLSGALVVDIVAATVAKAKRPSEPLRTRPCHRGYAHVRIYHNGSRRSIALHKLVWMAANRQLVPAGHIIHHGEAGKYANGIANLLLKDHCEHGWYHAWKASPRYLRQFKTYDDFREWKKTQPVHDDFYEEFD